MQEKGLGTFAVFMTAISTILGAILFLRFGFAVAHVGLLWTMAIIVLGHLVTIPTALAVAEIATNQKVEGGGAYYMISRSFGLSIGGAIGIALFLSQAISVAFYIIAFTVSTRDLLAWLEVSHGVVVHPWQVNYGFMALLTLLMLTKGAQVGVKALYGVVAVLVVALLSFFAGSGEPQAELDILRTIDETLLTSDGRTITRYRFIEVFTFIFPSIYRHCGRFGVERRFEGARQGHPPRYTLGDHGGDCGVHRCGLEILGQRIARTVGFRPTLYGGHRHLASADSIGIGSSSGVQCPWQCHHRAQNLASTGLGSNLSQGHRPSVEARKEV